MVTWLARPRRPSSSKTRMACGVDGCDECASTSAQARRAEELLAAIARILRDYDRFRARAEALAHRIPRVDGARRGAERIREILREVTTPSLGRRIRDPRSE